ncbi:hypothetical protein GCM10023322_78570 [Rugosimonospora acidiphila]|uniref:Clp R domain-containing protein n=1 Tax=Rugosimonospora acidiphila TaxID=556531 RepID=A0ABP9SSL2_9ACTN
MPKINVYLPDELAEAVRDSGVPVSAICQRALEQAVRRVTAIRETALGDLDDAALAARLPNFTARARATLRLAAERARTAGSTMVGSEDLLGGILDEGGNLAVQVLRALEIRPDQIASELARHQQTEADASGASPAGAGASGAGSAVADPSGAGQSQRFTGPAANALELAVTEATALGHNYVGCEHLLIGLVAEPDGTAGQILRSLGAELRLTRRGVVAALAGYVHLRAQASSAAGAADTTALAAVMSQQLQPLLDRIQRLEERVNPAPGA